ncbi:hypothetical protein [Sodalis glossinidius]|uniref:hypothetical protein n=1 Tax=Sodalis glossinidius TaxID=63612 RepID=UPI0002D7A95B|nr:hypothetical protein [Sodalis glossinidius]
MKDIIAPIDSEDGLFHDGDPAGDVRGTVVYAQWLNAMQGAVIDTQTEQKNILAAAGMQPNLAQNNQLAEAIKGLIQQLQEENSSQSLLKRNNGADIPHKTAFVANLGLKDIVERAQNAQDYLVKSGIIHDKANNVRNTQRLRFQGEGAQGSDIYFWE